MQPGSPPTTTLPHRYAFADLIVDAGQRRVLRGGVTVPLSRLSFEFLLALAENAPNLVTHDELIHRVWGARRVVTAENLAKRALILRHSLGDSAEQPRYFEGVRGQGYRLVAEVDADANEHEPLPLTAAARSVHGRTLRWLGVATLMLVAAAAGALLGWRAIDRLPRPRADARDVMRFELVAAPDAPLVDDGYSRIVAISPDGRLLAYTSRDNSIVVRSLDRLNPVRFVSLGTDTRNPTFSPDGQFLAYLDGGALKRMPALTDGPSETLAYVGQFTDGDIGWAADGTLLVANSKGVLRVPADGGPGDMLLEPDPTRDERAFGAPSLLPGGRVVLFSVEPTRAPSGSRIGVFDLDTKQRKYLLNGATQPAYLPSGHLLFVVDGELRAARFDLDRLELGSEQTTLATGVSVSSSGIANVAVAATGTLVYAAGMPQRQRSLLWVDRNGATEALSAPALNYTYPRLSPNGTHIVLDVRWPESDIWVWDLERESITRITHDPAENALPVWYPDGTRMAFGDGRRGNTNVYSYSLNGGGMPEQLTEGDRRQLPFTISPDGHYLLFGEDQPDGNWNMSLLDLETRVSRPLLAGGYSFWNTDLSPDGNWLVYQSNESGALEVYVRPFPDAAAGRWKISQEGGTKPMWGRDGQEIFYIDPRGMLMAVAVSTFPAFRAGRTASLFDTGTLSPQPYEVGARPYDLSLDGQRFLFTSLANAPDVQDKRIVVELNWTAELTRRLPANRRR